MRAFIPTILPDSWPLPLGKKYEGLRALVPTTLPDSRTLRPTKVWRLEGPCPQNFAGHMAPSAQQNCGGLRVIVPITLRDSSPLPLGKIVEV